MSYEIRKRTNDIQVSVCHGTIQYSLVLYVCKRRKLVQCLSHSRSVMTEAAEAGRMYMWQMSGRRISTE